jgi:hypothetical protein
MEFTFWIHHGEVWTELLIVRERENLIIGQVLLKGDMVYNDHGKRRGWNADLVGLDKGGAIGEGFEIMSGVALNDAFKALMEGLL